MVLTGAVLGLFPREIGLPQSCSPGFSYTAFSNLACCAINGACIYFTACAAGTVYGPVTSVGW